ncbi:MAG: MFS transporter [Burkholderiales bacterium]|jgi:predicted MFS family arabinose efflux permease
MESDSPAVQYIPAQAHATRTAFFIAGLGMAAWAPLVPFAKERLGIQEAALGTLLLCLGAGSIVAMPLAGILTSRWGCRRVLILSVLVICATLPLLAYVSSMTWLAVALFFFGAGMGSLDCAMNIQAIILERASGRTMMSGFHGLFSLGGVVGAGGVSGLLSVGMSPFNATWMVTVTLAVLLALSASQFLPYGGRNSGPAFALAKGVVLFIGVLCFILFLAEGAVLDWSAVFLADVRGMSPTHAGLGYAAFAATMTIGRLTGDRFVRRVGPKWTVVGGGLLAAAGLALATLISSWPVGILGFALVGVGCANIVPVMFSLAGKQSEMPESIAVPAITTLGYAGVLLGPALIGFVAHATNLGTALLILASLLLCVAASARLLKILG